MNKKKYTTESLSQIRQLKNVKTYYRIELLLPLVAYCDLLIINSSMSVTYEYVTNTVIQ